MTTRVGTGDPGSPRSSLRSDRSRRPRTSISRGVQSAGDEDGGVRRQQQPAEETSSGAVGQERSVDRARSRCQGRQPRAAARSAATRLDGGEHTVRLSGPSAGRRPRHRVLDAVQRLVRFNTTRRHQRVRTDGGREGGRPAGVALNHRLAAFPPPEVRTITTWSFRSAYSTSDAVTAFGPFLPASTM